MPTTTLQIPNVCGVMALPQCSVFPHGGVPLRFFEPRYQRLLEQAMEGTAMLAIGNWKGDVGEHGLEHTEERLKEHVASIGTVCLIRASHEQKDGTYHVLLHGVVRVQFMQWLTLDEPFPRAEVMPLVTYFEPEGKGAAARRVLLDALDEAAEKLPFELKKSIIAGAEETEDLGLLTDILAHQFVQEPVARYALLAESSLGKRVSLLVKYLKENPLNF